MPVPDGSPPGGDLPTALSGIDGLLEDGIMVKVNMVPLRV